MGELLHHAYLIVIFVFTQFDKKIAEKTWSSRKTIARRRAGEMVAE